MPPHFILNKPDGYLAQFVSNSKHKQKLLGELYAFPEGTMAIGRLDADSEGLLLLTTDGMMSELVRSKKVEKEYWVLVDGIITSEAIAQLQQGVEIGFSGKKYTTLPCQVSSITTPELPKKNKPIRADKHGPTSWINIILNEGKFRQVRKMTAAVGFPTLRLIRVRIGSIELGELKPGEVRELKVLKV